VLDAIGVPEEHRNWPKPGAKGLFDALPRGLAITPPDVLFKKIEDEQVADWSVRFSGGG
jgi:methionyl-tRNA synthetase